MDAIVLPSPSSRQVHYILDFLAAVNAPIAPIIAAPTLNRPGYSSVIAATTSRLDLGFPASTPSKSQMYRFVFSRCHLPCISPCRQWPGTTYRGSRASTFSTARIQSSRFAVVLASNSI
jgi:hypothetical protein